MGAAGVEVSEQSAVPGLVGLALLLQVVSLGVDEVGNGGLNGGLGVAVGVGGPNGAILGDGDHVGEAGGVAVNGGGGGEDNVVDIVALHGAEEGDTSADIDAVVVERSHARLADGL